MAPIDRTKWIACLIVFTAAIASAFGQELPQIPTLQPSVPKPTATLQQPPLSTVPDATLLPGTPSILTKEPAVCCETPKKKWEFLPNSLLWEPKLADKQEARLSVVQNDVDSFFSNQTTDPSIGLTAGILRFRPEIYPWIEWQVDVFAVAHLRFSRGDESIAQNYRYGLPFSFRAGNWQGKIGYEHTSTQLGDELIEGRGRRRMQFERDEAVAALGYVWENQLRTYGQVGYAFYRSIPGAPERWRYDVGFEWFKRQATGKFGQPFAAVNAAFNPEVDYDVSMNYQVGWMWRKPDQRLGQIRMYAEFFDGRSLFGQLFNNREQYAGFGISLDY